MGKNFSQRRISKYGKDSTSNLIPFGTIQLLRFKKRAHGNMMLWWHFNTCTYYRLPTTYLALNQMKVL